MHCGLRPAPLRSTPSARSVPREPLSAGAAESPRERRQANRAVVTLKRLRVTHARLRTICSYMSLTRHALRDDGTSSWAARWVVAPGSRRSRPTQPALCARLSPLRSDVKGLRRTVRRAHHHPVVSRRPRRQDS